LAAGAKVFRKIGVQKERAERAEMGRKVAETRECETQAIRILCDNYKIKSRDFLRKIFTSLTRTSASFYKIRGRTR
jgi:hypothetical protein